MQTQPASFAADAAPGLWVNASLQRGPSGGGARDTCEQRPRDPTPLPTPKCPELHPEQQLQKGGDGVSSFIQSIFFFFLFFSFYFLPPEKSKDAGVLQPNTRRTLFACVCLEASRNDRMAEISRREAGGVVCMTKLFERAPLKTC